MTRELRTTVINLDHVRKAKQPLTVVPTLPSEQSQPAETAPSTVICVQLLRSITRNVTGTLNDLADHLHQFTEAVEYLATSELRDTERQETSELLAQLEKDFADLTVAERTARDTAQELTYNFNDYHNSTGSHAGNTQ